MVPSVTVCVTCGQKMHGANITACLRCDGSIKPWKPTPDKGTPFDRSRFLNRRQLCRRCNNYGDHEYKGESVTGCGLLDKPCDVEKLWQIKDDNWCPLGLKEGDTCVIDVELTGDDIPDPQSDLAVITHACGDIYKECRQLSRPGIAAYAERIGADLIELEGDQCPDFKLANKFRVAAIAERYRRSIFLDVDLFVSPDAPNLFDIVPEESFGIYDEILCAEVKGSVEWYLDQAEVVRASQMMPPAPFPWSGNTGVMVIPQRLAALYRPPEYPIPNHWCAEQQLLTLRLMAAEATVYFLPWQLNCLSTGRFWEQRQEASIIHYNGVWGRRLTKKMREWILVGR